MVFENLEPLNGIRLMQNLPLRWWNVHPRFFLPERNYLSVQCLVP